MNEVWAEINGFPNYAISNLGEIVNIKFSRSLKPRVNARGYNHVILFGDAGRKEYYVHQLVAQCFIGDFRHGSHIIHIDGDRSNNSVDNLRMRGSRGEIDYVPVRVRGSNPSPTPNRCRISMLRRETQIARLPKHTESSASTLLGHTP